MIKKTVLLMLTLLLFFDIPVFAELPEALTPAPSSYILSGTGYWETPMDINDTQAVWAMLMAPVTVVKGNQKSQQVLLSQPDAGSEPVGEVTRDSQGLHVLETRDDGWSLVETYSSSFAGSTTQAWNRLVQGYIRTDMLETITPTGKFALLVDKLDQRLYIFEDGELYDVLVISTGLANERQPYNETRSGEFLLVSPVGGFEVEGLNASMGLRFNFGDILHEVPTPSATARKITSVMKRFWDSVPAMAASACSASAHPRAPT